MTPEARLIMQTTVTGNGRLRTFGMTDLPSTGLSGDRITLHTYIEMSKFEVGLWLDETCQYESKNRDHHSHKLKVKATNCFWRVPNPLGKPYPTDQRR